MRAFWLIALFLGAWSHSVAAQPIPEDKNTAVILAYHRIGEDHEPGTNLHRAQFEEHLQIIKHEGYNVLTLPALLSALEAGHSLPPKTIAITLEGGFKSAYKEAVPLLLKENLPFTVFYASDQAARDTEEYMSWKDLTALSKHKTVSFGLLPASYQRLYNQDETEALKHLHRARIAARETLGTEIKLFSYPFGEYARAYKKLIKAQGFDAAFGLHAGAVSHASDMYELPRFAMTESYGDSDRFRSITQALPMPVSDIEPTDLYLKQPLKQFGFTVSQSLKPSLEQLSCYIAGQEIPKIQIINTRVEIFPAEPISVGRTRLNCTLPGPKDENDRIRWRWFSRLLIGD